MSGLKVAVVGGGNGSYTMAGDFALAGHRVRMWPGAREKHAELYRKETIFLEGELGDAHKIIIFVAVIKRNL